MSVTGVQGSEQSVQRGPTGSLPMLRRYLRAVIGDQLAGDRLAASLWEGMPNEAREEGDPARLFGAATRAWRRGMSAPPARPFSNRALLPSLPPGMSLPRQVGVLTDVFGLTVHEVASVLDRSDGEVTRLLAQTRAERRMPLDTDVLIVEDNALVAEHLSRIVAAQGGRAMTAPTYARAVRAAQARPPQVLICDFDLGPGPNGIDVVRTLTAEHDCVSLFVTGYPELVLRGTDGEPAFVLSKPYAEARVAAALHYAVRAQKPALVAA